ncbi:uncharacterized protein LOC115371997 isoform X2 [Myripristis murdjan]|uniref:uncharacterized protein LOC115371997 isoform X2 n=1 Tax=Myripristis murdjan TaxID=586833 RepID=UPI00117601A7|nr:uncharacterized protein LOC115371997 isoform X2 [Myripristis murdjan]
MPSQGSTMKTCVVCRTQLYVACKTCKTCKAEQPHKLRLKRKMEKFDQKRDSWVSSNLRNRTTSHIRDQAHILLEKLQSLGVRAVVFMSKPRKKPNAWVSEVLAPRCQLTETSTACLDKMKELYDFVIQVLSPVEAGPHKVLQENRMKPCQPQLDHRWSLQIPKQRRLAFVPQQLRLDQRRPDEPVRLRRPRPYSRRDPELARPFHIPKDCRQRLQFLLQKKKLWMKAVRLPAPCFLGKGKCCLSSSW